MENVICGGFSAFRPLKSDEKKLLEQVLEPIDGVSYLPLAVATQLVTGTNYAFLCESNVVRPDSTSYNSLVIVHEALPYVKETPSLMEIKTVKII